MRNVTRRDFLRTTALGATALTAGCQMFQPSVQPRSKSELVKMFTGVHNFMITPFHDDYALDADGLRENIADHARHNHPDMTIVVSGGLGEVFRMTVEEHREVVQAAVAGAGGVYPTIAGCAGAMPNAKRMAQNAQRAGVDGVFLFASPHGCDNAEGAYDYLSEVAKSVDIGAMIYICKDQEFWPDVLKRLAKLPNVMGFKDGSGDVNVGKGLEDLIGEEFLWIAESEEHTAKSLPVGARAYTTAIGTFTPDACHEFWKYGVAAEVDKMNEVREKKLNPIIKLRDLQPGYGISGIKVGLEALGRAGGPVRPPGTQVKPEDRAAIREIARKHSEPSAVRTKTG